MLASMRGSFCPRVRKRFVYQPKCFPTMFPLLHNSLEIPSLENSPQGKHATLRGGGTGVDGLVNIDGRLRHTGMAPGRVQVPFFLACAFTRATISGCLKMLRAEYARSPRRLVERRRWYTLWFWVGLRFLWVRGPWNRHGWKFRHMIGPSTVNLSTNPFLFRGPLLSDLRFPLLTSSVGDQLEKVGGSPCRHVCWSFRPAPFLHTHLLMITFAVVRPVLLAAAYCLANIPRGNRHRGSP
jgi:hypothetical protein